MSKIDHIKIARYQDLAMSFPDNPGQKDSFAYSDSPAIGPLLEQIQNGNGANLGSSSFAEGMYLAPRSRNLNGVDIACVGIPLDQSENYDLSGPRQGPHAVRHASAGLGEIYEPANLNIFKACSIIDWGDFELDKDNKSLRTKVELISETFRNFAHNEVAPLSIGGQHVATYGALEGLSLDGERPISLIHLDAHHRSFGDQFGPRLANNGYLRLATVKGLIDPERSVLAGLRARGLSGLDFCRHTGMNVITAREIQARNPKEIAQSIRDTVGDGPCYISIDASIFDCGILPSAQAPVPFGLTVREIRDLLDNLCGINLVGADIMELSPHYDNACVSATVASAIGFELLGLLTVSKMQGRASFANTENPHPREASRQIA